MSSCSSSARSPSVGPEQRYEGGRAWPSAVQMFHVALNDLLLLNNFDVFRHTRQLGAAYEKRFTFSILNGTMTIRGRRIYVGQQLRLLFHKVREGCGRRRGLFRGRLTCRG